MSVLHITNGDSAAEGLRASGVTTPQSPALPWRDVLHDGPVQPDDDETLFRARRGAFLAERDWTVEAEAVIGLAARDATLALADEAIVLWFEPDLYDQLQLVQILARIAARQQERSTQNGLAISIVPADTMLGTLEASAFQPLFEARRDISEADVARGSEVWRAFTDSTPDALQRVARAHGGSNARNNAGAKSYANNPEARLPYLDQALHRLLQEYPSIEGGLSRSERQICDALCNGAMPLGELFRAAHHDREEWTFLGDLSFAWYVERLQDAARPLVQFVDMQPMQARADAASSGARADDASHRAIWSRLVTLTEFGQHVLRGTEDAIAANGIDRWIGGVHLTTHRHWRWNGEQLDAVTT